MNALQPGGAVEARCTAAVLCMIIKDNLPFSATEKEGLQYYTSVLAPRFQLPKRKAITRAVKEKYEVLSTIVKSRFDKAKSITLTTDIWTDTANTQGYLGVTAHFLENSSMACIEVETIKLSTNRTAQYISQILENFLMKWRIAKAKVTAVVTDGGANIVKAVKETFGEHKHLECVAHKLNTTITNVTEKNEPFKNVITKTKAIVTYFKQSTTAADHLRKAQCDGEQVFRLTQDVPTRMECYLLYVAPI